MSKVLLIRHALTPYAIAGSQGRFCGSSDPSLTPAGIDEAKHLGELLKLAPIDKVYSSPLKRSQETAKYIVSERPLSIHLDPLLSEIDYGEWEGLTKGEIMNNYAHEYQQFELDPIAGHPSSGEPPNNCLQRAIQWLGSIEGNYILALTHKTWTRLLLCHLLDLPIQKYRDTFDIKIASITVIKGHGKQWQLDALNYGATYKRILG